MLKWRTITCRGKAIVGYHMRAIALQIGVVISMKMLEERLAMGRYLYGSLHFMTSDPDHKGS
jgi:hypothetical protein